LYLTGDPFFTYDPTPSIQCGQVIGRKVSEALVHKNQQNQEIIQPDPVPEIQLSPSPISSNPITTPPSSVSTSSRSTPYSTPLSSPTTQGFKEDFWDLHSDTTQDSNYSQPSTFSGKPKSNKNIPHYLEPEVAKQFDTSKGKTLRSGKVTFSEPVTAKKWTAAAKNAIANLTKKQVSKVKEAHPTKLYSAKQQT
jgi:hypothetical protein